MRSTYSYNAMNQPEQYKSDRKTLDFWFYFYYSL
ncbi:hypothetical protein KAI36_03896 [Paenibacillus sp. S02]|nr:hypothetical protein KAI36_03896 [Paenibacillus sp. S02]